MTWQWGGKVGVQPGGNGVGGDFARISMYTPAHEPDEAIAATLTTLPLANSYRSYDLLIGG